MAVTQYNNKRYRQGHNVPIISDLLTASKYTDKTLPYNCYKDCGWINLLNLHDWYNQDVCGVHDLYCDTTLANEVIDTFSKMVANTGIKLLNTLTYDDIFTLAKYQSLYGDAFIKVNKIDNEFDIEILSPLCIKTCNDCEATIYTDLQTNHKNGTCSANKETRTINEFGKMVYQLQKVVFRNDYEHVIEDNEEVITDLESTYVFRVKNNSDCISDIERTRNFLALDAFTNSQQYVELKIGRGRITVPPSMIQTDGEGNTLVNLDESIYTPIKGGLADETAAQNITNTQFDFRPDEFEKLLKRHETQVFRTAGLSSYIVDPVSINVSSAKTATEIIYSITLTKKTLVQKLKYIQETLYEIAELIGDEVVLPQLDDLIPDMYKYEVLNQAKKFLAWEDIIAQLYPELSEEELKEKVKQTANEQMINIGMQALPDPSNRYDT